MRDDFKTLIINRSVSNDYSFQPLAFCKMLQATTVKLAISNLDFFKCFKALAVFERFVIRRNIGQVQYPHFTKRLQQLECFVCEFSTNEPNKYSFAWRFPVST